MRKLSAIVFGVAALAVFAVAAVTLGGRGSRGTEALKKEEADGERRARGRAQGCGRRAFHLRGLFELPAGRRAARAPRQDVSRSRAPRSSRSRCTWTTGTTSAGPTPSPRASSASGRASTPRPSARTVSTRRRWSWTASGSSTAATRLWRRRPSAKPRASRRAKCCSRARRRQTEGFVRVSAQIDNFPKPTDGETVNVLPRADGKRARDRRGARRELGPQAHARRRRAQPQDSGRTARSAGHFVQGGDRRGRSRRVGGARTCAPSSSRRSAGRAACWPRARSSCSTEVARTQSAARGGHVTVVSVEVSC